MTILVLISWVLIPTAIIGWIILQRRDVGYFSLARAYGTRRKWNPLGLGKPISDFSLYFRAVDKDQKFGRQAVNKAYLVPEDQGLLIVCYGMNWLYPKVFVPWNAIRFMEDRTLQVQTPEGVVEIVGAPIESLLDYKRRM